MDLSVATHFFTNLAVDWIILFTFAVFVVLDVLRAGASRACALSLALPATLLIATQLPNAFFVGSLAKQLPEQWGSLIIFAVLLVGMYILARHMCGQYTEGHGRPVQALLAGIGTVIIAATVWMSTPALQEIWHFGPQVSGILIGQWTFWFLLASFGALAFSRE